MESNRRAVIDVGTNSVKLLVAAIAGREVCPVWEGARQTRLGESLYERNRLQPGAITRTAEAVRAFVEKARSEGAGAIRIIATSAARDAANADQLKSAIEQACGIAVEIITGDEEADLVFHGITSDPAFANKTLLLLDVGGGSTEFILGSSDQKHFRQSYPLGTVRLMEMRKRHGEGAATEGAMEKAPGLQALAECRGWLKEFLRTQVEPTLRPAIEREIKGPIQLVGTGGTASVLGCMEAKLERFDRQLLESVRLSLTRLQWHVEHLWTHSLAERKQIVGLPKERADVILTGAAIFEAIMLRFNFAELRISTRGLRFAAVLEGAGTASSPRAGPSD